MKNLIVIFLAMVAAIFLVRSVRTSWAEMDKFNKREALIAETGRCLEAADWNCAEKGVRELLCDAPHDTNLQMHMAIILYEQERYEDCIAYVQSRKFKHGDLNFLKEKSESLMREMAELQLERSMHFRVEFEGRPARSDIAEALG